MKKWFSKTTNWMFFISMLCIVGAVASPLFVYLRYSGYGDYTGIAELGPIGDFVGGTTVTFLTAASVFLLIGTNIMQRKELQMSRQSVDEMVKQTEASVEQMKASVRQAEQARKETQVTNDTMKKQQFETTFFNMLSLHHQIVSDTQINMFDEWVEEGELVSQAKPYEGRAAFEKLKEVLEERLAQEKYLHNMQAKHSWEKGMYIPSEEWKEEFLATPNEISQNLLDIVYKDFHDEYGNAIGHYMRNNYRIVKFIVESLVKDEEEQKRIKEEEKRDTVVGDKKFYFGTLRAQWSNAEFELIFINALYGKNKKFKNLIKKHDVLDIRETKKLKLEDKPEGSFILKVDTPIPVAYTHLIEGNIEDEKDL
ncbi:putative phage abortive infection protein [Bacillus cereus group sp. MYBK120-1]|uniref:putative phage abortive infection protein n=1 Tax=Bacillus cereus group TaxID=86661 RepID=UPI00234D6D65|nr:putative phage abortive infection protein [Bacillus cereus]MDC7729669.1 putative phage abortive infection protein [Bacillus cereus]